ncbi:hypothetical protein HELRODRAFT_89705 [Helobdella robusta]|uniref:EGF-like domain-containing protein n=1 Tax=Helobdella robusta TaxID=6412 RepID=T1G7G2_HELRO|nr:hypothetical protein HELRODRAFT_89705 [Helobdella robusta]ESN92285.1 hypothetical protein HELRODRAFT_89705 [Helobdella robusta]
MECLCPFGYFGLNCNERATLCLVDECFNGGTCLTMSNETFCICPPGTSGSKCENLITSSSHRHHKCHRDVCFYGGAYCQLDSIIFSFCFFDCTINNIR